MKTLSITEEEIKDILTMKEVLEVVESVFRADSKGETQMPPKIYLNLPRGDFRAMPASIPGAAGMKWVNAHPRNPEIGLPSVMATLIYNDPDTGRPLAIMEATTITSLRTGASAGIASKYLARKDSETLGLVGTGEQAHTQLLAIGEIFGLESVKVFDLNKDRVKEFISTFTEYNVEFHSLEETLKADIVSTATPVRKPIIKSRWIQQGTHINAIGADAKGKQELEGNLLKRSKIVVDNIEQASHSGEINVPLVKGIIKSEDIHATLGEVVEGIKPGREEDDEITVFDSTGLAIQDLATAKLVYEKVTKGKV
jgi:alanine dehydrogenase